VTQPPPTFGQVAGTDVVPPRLEDVNLIVTAAYGRAGSLFLHSLFDGHPSVLNLPHFSSMYARIPRTIGNPRRRINWFIATYPEIFDSTVEPFGGAGGRTRGNFGAAGDEDLIVDPDRFRERFVDLAAAHVGANGPCSRRTFFLLAHLAYGLCVRDFDPADIRYVFYQPHWPGADEWGAEWSAMMADFPDLFFIAMTRDPRQDWTSRRKLQAERLGRDLGGIPAISLLINIHLWSKHSDDLRRLVGGIGEDHVRIIDLERLHVGNERILRSLCAWLGIDFHENLLRSTFNGRQWFGNTANAKQASAFNPGMKRDTWRTELPPEDKQTIERLLPGTIGYLGYALASASPQSHPDDAMARFRYASRPRLIVDCFLNYADTPSTAVLQVARQTIARLGGRRRDTAADLSSPADESSARGSGQLPRLAALKRLARKARTLFAVTLLSARSVARFRGGGLERTRREIDLQQQGLKDASLPPGALVDEQG
jgi:hypothetical protein